NRGPRSLEVLRYVRALGDNALVVLGNHDLHLLAIAYGGRARLRPSDTVSAILQAPDRARLLHWLLQRPLAHYDPQCGDLLVHAGLVPQWDVRTVLRLARSTARRLQRDPAGFFAGMYGDRPTRWRPQLRGAARHRFVVNVLTRLRYCDARGTIDLRNKSAPRLGRHRLAPDTPRPWFEVPRRRSAGTRIIFGHWSTLGLLQRPNLLALDTGCVWGGRLTACDLDNGTIYQVPSSVRLPIGESD
ncbi:MAG: symmetrical bis(5'-nucleosyl)-tetraphosphatase, partial [Steroidobacteraceae bacterium]|nr:symmetrical bis(5'-nucleosyl)-tetraphosphatase [Steroidobacteraceae bacterium]